MSENQLAEPLIDWLIDMVVVVVVVGGGGGKGGGIIFLSLLSKIVAWLNSPYERQISSVVSRDFWWQNKPLKFRHLFSPTYYTAEMMLWLWKILSIV